MSRIFFATICFLIYGSLYPWHFYARELPANPVWILLHSWPEHYFDASEITDIAVNVLLYAPLGMFGFLSLSGKHRKAVAVAAPIAIGFALSCSMELLQLFDAGRDTGALDVVSNTVGAAIGVACGALFERYRASGSLLLLICFGAYELLPHAANASLIEWLAIGRLAETAIDAPWALRIYPALLLLLILGRRTDLAELSGAVLAYFVWRYGLSRLAWRSQLLAALFTAMIVIRGLAPYHFTSMAAPFSWIPFGGMFYSERMAAMSITLGKTFAYGTLVWLLRDSGLRMRYAAAAAATTLAAIEVTQMYLPGRTPEITDPLLALILAWVLSVI